MLQWDVPVMHVDLHVRERASDIVEERVEHNVAVAVQSRVINL